MPERESRELFPYSLDEIDEIMVSGDERRLDELKQLLKERGGFDDEKFELSVAARKLRKQTHESQKEEIKKRLAESLAVTEEELEMGAFIQNIEPQVRNAVKALRRKGYNTVLSGFWDFNSQRISFAEPYLKNLDPGVLAALKEASVKVKDDSLSFECDEINLEKIKERWDAIAEIVPNLRMLAGPSQIQAAKSFRKRFDENGRLKPEWVERYIK